MNGSLIRTFKHAFENPLKIFDIDFRNVKSAKKKKKKEKKIGVDGKNEVNSIFCEFLGDLYSYFKSAVFFC